MPADLVDKIYIGYNAPYALGNMLAPQCVPAPIVSPWEIPNHDRPNCLRFRHGPWILD